MDIKKAIQKIRCKLGYHKYVKIQDLSWQCARIGCTSCRKEFAINHELRCVLPWDNEFNHLYAEVMKVELVEW